MMVRVNRIISILYRYSQRFFAEQLSPFGVEVGQVPVIMQIYTDPGMTQEAICAARGLDKGTVARTVRKMELAGFARREIDPDDRRVNHIYPTARLLALRPQMEATVDELHRVLYMGFTEDEIHLTAGMLSRMRENLAAQLGKQNNSSLTKDAEPYNPKPNCKK